MRYLITGGAGFIGSHLCEALLADGHNVVAVDDLSTGSLDNISNLGDRFRCVVGSVLDRALMDTLIAESDIVVHLAAAVGVKLVLTQQVQAMLVNLKGTETVLELAAQHGCRVVLASTSEVYGRSTQCPFREDATLEIAAPTEGRWGYASAKVSSEFLALSYHREQGLPVVVCRLFNIVGPRQTGRYGMVLPRFVEQARANNPITVYGDGTQSRCFAHVYDCVEALMALSQHPDAVGRIFNVGSQEEITIGALAQLVRDTLESRSDIVHMTYADAYGHTFCDIERRQPDLTRLAELIGYTPRFSIRDVLRDMVSRTRATS